MNEHGRARQPSRRKPARSDRGNIARGRWGERLAAQHYRRAGYDIIAQNWYGSDGEIDLIAQRGETVVICEVKARRTAAFGVPAEAVTVTKQQRIRRLAAEWLQATSTRAPTVRFDIVAITGSDLTVIEGAF